jgi:site-specific DNA-cytosine methylase
MRGRSDGEFHGSASHLTKTMVSSNLVFRVRRFTERELFRLMDLSEEDIDKIQAAGISKTQQAKMAGNSICVNVLYHIFRKMFVDSERETAQLELF